MPEKTNPNIKHLQQLAINNEKLLKTALSFIQKKRTELMQQCFQNNQSNPQKFVKCADQVYNRTQKILESFQYKLLHSKFAMTDCLLIKCEDLGVCRGRANQGIGKYKDQFVGELKNMK